MYPFYIKKEDVRDVTIWQRKHMAIVLISMAVVMGMMQYIVFPKMLSLYTDLGAAPEKYVQFSPQITTGFIIFVVGMVVYLLGTQPDFSRVDAIAKKYKSGEMIKTRELVDTKLEWLGIGVLVGTFAYTLLTMILPIYSLTSQF